MNQAIDWDQVVSSQGWARWPHEGVVRAFAQVAAGRRGLAVLDAGCGPGTHLRFLEGEAHVAHGADTSEIALRQAAEGLEALGFTPRLALASVTALPYQRGTFDAVLDVEVFAYLGDQVVDAWREVSRILRPGGTIVSVGFGTATDAALMARLHHPRLTTDVDVAEHARAVGMEVVDQQLQRRTEGPRRRWIEEVITTARVPG